MSEGCEASPVIKERGHQEAIKMAAEVQDWNKREQCFKQWCTSYPKTLYPD